MNTESTTAGGLEATGTIQGLAALARINFRSLDPTEILAMATDGVAALCPCRIEASYCAVDEEMKLCPSTQSERPELTNILERSSWKGKIEFPQGGWGWAFPLCHRDAVQGCLVVGANAELTPDHILLLELFAQQVGSALAVAELHERAVRRPRQLDDSNEVLAYAVQRLEARPQAHEQLGAAMAAGAGPQGIVEA